MKTTRTQKMFVIASARCHAGRLAGRSRNGSPRNAGLAQRDDDHRRERLFRPVSQGSLAA